MERFKIIVITTPDFVDDEADKISRLLESGVDYVHIRKPDWSARDVLNLIEDIPYNMRRKLKLHGHFQLLDGLTLGGVHLNSRNPKAPDTALNVSASCHSLEEIDKISTLGYEYVTLSPIFDSISKQGYHSKFDIDQLPDGIRGKRVIALGGVTPELFLTLQQKEFAGAALLGYIWSGDFELALTQLKAALKTHQNQ